MIVDGHGERLGLAQMHQDTLGVARWQERRAQGESEVNGLFARGPRLRQMREGTEGLLEGPHRLAVG